jgi:hypothetical protein
MKVLEKELQVTQAVEGQKKRAKLVKKLIYFKLLYNSIPILGYL